MYENQCCTVLYNAVPYYTGGQRWLWTRPVLARTAQLGDPKHASAHGHVTARS